MAKINWGIIGCGNVTELKSGPAFRKVPDSDLVAVMRRTAAKAQDYAERHKVPRWYADADALISDPEVTAVYIATPPDTHAEYAIRVARAGKAVYLEKPMARTYAECQSILETCDKFAVPLFVAYYRRQLPGFLKVRELIESGRIGKVLAVTIELCYTPRPEDHDPENLPWRVKPEISGGGYFVDLAAHQLDYLDYLFGPIQNADGVATNHARLYDAEDTVAATFEFENGVIGNGLWTFASSEASRMDSIRLVGSDGDVTIASFNLDTPIRLRTPNGVEEIPVPTTEHVQQPLIKTVVDALLNRGVCPSTGASAARTNRVIDEILSNRR